ncbi:MAG: hypothetical protein ACYTG3_15445 [Planctomycetota bacterium]
MYGLRTGGLLLLLATVSSCAYLGDRGMDFLDMFRISAGVGTTIGVRGRTLGVVDTGLMVGVKPNFSALGWRYGKPLYFDQADKRFDGDQAEIIKATSVRNLDWTEGTYEYARTSAALLPALLTWTDASPESYEWTVAEEGDTFEERHWIWSAETTRNNRYAQIHAFDIEVEVGLGVYVEAGFSPGEALDFLLGIFGIDIAKDDGRLSKKEE